MASHFGSSFPGSALIFIRAEVNFKTRLVIAVYLET